MSGSFDEKRKNCENCENCKSFDEKRKQIEKIVNIANCLMKGDKNCENCKPSGAHMQVVGEWIVL